MSAIKDSKYLSSGVLRRGRQPNPHHVMGMLINEGGPPTRSSNMEERERGPDGRYLPSSGGGKPKSNKPKSKSKAKQSDKRKSNPSGKSQSKSTQRKKNPDGPEVQNLKVEVIGEKEDVQDLADAIAEQEMTTP